MQGAREYAPLFRTGQYGRLFISSGRHARGYEFTVWVLPEGEQVPEGHYPSNKAVEVYGVLGGQRGWTEWYGWLHEGPWQADFEALVAERRARLAKAAEDAEQRTQEQEAQRKATHADVLASYGSTVPAGVAATAKTADGGM